MAFVTVEVNMSDFDDDDLIDELADRGYNTEFDEFTEEEINDILERYSCSLPGTLGYNIYEKLRKKG